MTPPKPPVRAEKVSLWRYLRLFRRDILSAQPARLYRAWMAEFRTPFFRSYLCNDPALVKRVLSERPQDFPKSGRIREGLAPLLGNSVFLTNGQDWARQRRIIDPAFQGGRREFRVAAPDGEERQLVASVDFLNKKMREIRDTGKVVGNERIAIMAALNIAHEHLQKPASSRAAKTAHPFW